VFNILSGPSKTPYTDGGISKLQGAVYGVLKEYEEGDPPALVEGSSVVNVPESADVSTADKAARVLNDFTADTELAGAIHLVNLSITLSV
jgi:hypothetical protein